ncbi:hypothetical protein KGM_207395 [Danaus plexippus plexippus]|uniref:TIL domain-containing protein n=1 Tax=Danaus plexippus plexippus TaxID=278856 RepID=A0A212FH34_DANPL|nr:hypothetical protein KGM_207395 [Danaus plexippus plexippus]
MKAYIYFVIVTSPLICVCRDEDKIAKACYWPNEIYEPCFGGCAEISCDNPRNHLRPCYPYCEPGCVCEEPYVRDDRTHQCVLPQDCSPTQMGIPVPSKRSGQLGNPAPKMVGRLPRSHIKRDNLQEISDVDASMSHVEDFRRAAEVSRMGNYFNIVIAPPPIKALQPRKTLQSDTQTNPGKNDICNANRLYDYDDPEGIKRHSFVDERRNWRKKALLKSYDDDHKEWDDRGYEHVAPKYLDEPDAKYFGGAERQDMDRSESLYRGQRRYDDTEKANLMHKIRSSEVGHQPAFTDKEADKKQAFTMTCERVHERYEPCFAGCAAVTCDNPRERLHPCYPFCEPGCICIQPYVRDDRTHKCVLPEECSKGLKGIPDLGDDT